MHVQRCGLCTKTAPPHPHPHPPQLSHRRIFSSVPRPLKKHLGDQELPSSPTCTDIDLSETDLDSPRSGLACSSIEIAVSQSPEVLEFIVSHALSTTLRDAWGFRLDRNTMKTRSQVMEEFYSQENNVKNEWDKLLRKKNVLNDLKGKELKALIRNFGIPKSRRPQIWPFLLKSLYPIVRSKGLYAELCSQKLSDNVADQIERDLRRTFPNHKHFTASGEKIQTLKRVLSCFALHLPEIGYCQSLNFIAAVFLIVLDEELAFWSIVSLLCSSKFDIRDYYTPEMQGIRRDLNVFENLFRKKLPTLFTKIVKLGLSSETLCVQWFLTLFSSSFPFETTLRIWDCMFSEGDKVLFRFALGFFVMYEKQLLDCMDMEDLYSSVRNLASNLTAVEAFVKTAFYGIGSLSKVEISKLRNSENQRLAFDANRRF